MNIMKINKRITRDVLDVVNTMNSYRGIEQTEDGWTFHKEKTNEVLDIDFNLKMTYDGLVVAIRKSYDKDYVSGGHYSEDSTSEIDILALAEWLEDNNIYTNTAHEIAERLQTKIDNAFQYVEYDIHLYNVFFEEYNSNSCEMENAIHILITHYTDIEYKQHIQQAFYDVKVELDQFKN